MKLQIPNVRFIQSEVDKLKQKSKRLRVLQVNKLYYPAIGGIERVVQQIAEGLSEEVDMHVLVCSDTIQYKKEILNGVHITRLPKLFQFGSLPVPLGFNMTLRHFSKTKDIIHLHMPFPLGDIACLLSGFKGKIIVWWHSDVVRQKKMMRLYKPVMLRMLKRADAIVVATKGHIEGSSYLKPFREKCVVIPFGVDEKVEQAADLYWMQQTKKKEERNKTVKFLFVGRLVYYKGCDVLLKAFANVQGAELEIVGEGALEEECKSIVDAYGIQDKVHFCGKLTEIELFQKYAECDVFVLPSVAKSEAFGLVQIEAMAFGKPVINTKLPSGVPMVSLHGETGLTVEPGDVKQFMQAMQWMVDHPKERLQMGKKARERMKTEYRQEQMLKKVFQLYNEQFLGYKEKKQ